MCARLDNTCPSHQVTHEFPLIAIHHCLSHLCLPEVSDKLKDVIPAVCILRFIVAGDICQVPILLVGPEGHIVELQLVIVAQHVCPEFINAFFLCMRYLPVVKEQVEREDERLGGERP